MARSKWSFDEYVRRPGHEFPMMPQFGLSRFDKNIASVDPYWMVQACFGEPGTTPEGSASFGQCRSLAEAEKQMAELIPTETRYTDWVIVEFKPTIVGKVIYRRPVQAEVDDG